MTYTARPRHPVTGRRFRISAPTTRELDAYLHHVESLRRELRFGIRSADEIERDLRRLQHGPVTLERAALAYLDRPGLAANTRRGVRSALDGHLAPLAKRPIASLDGPTVSAWVEDLARRGLEVTTIATMWRKLRAIARYATERGWITGAPWGDWQPSRRARRGQRQREAARTVDEFVRLVQAARELDAKEYTGLALKILIASLLGLRQGELAGLRWYDVVWGPPLVITIARQWISAPVKGRRAKALESIPELAIALVDHRAKLEELGLYSARGPIFPSHASEPGLPRAYEKGEVLTRLHIRKAVQLADLPNIRAWSAHSCRDTFVTLEASAAGGDLRRVQERSRHASLASLARYLRSMDRNPTASPALRELPGLDDAGDAVSHPQLLLTQPKETRR